MHNPRLVRAAAGAIAVGVAGAEALAKLRTSSTCKLAKLDLSGNKGFGPEGAAALASVPARLSVKLLTLGGDGVVP